jgi:hypothetical protein
MGIEVTIYNPQLDPEHHSGRLLANLLADVLSGARVG